MAHRAATFPLIPNFCAALKLLFCSMLLVLVAGCASYQFGPTSGVQARTRSIRVQPFENETLEPRLSEAVDFALRRRLQQEGTYELVTRGEADVIVTGAIVRYDRSALSFEPNDILTARDLSISLIAHIEAVDKASGRKLLDRDVHGRTTVRAGADFGSAERQAVPLMAEDIADNITALLVDGTW